MNEAVFKYRFGNDTLPLGHGHEHHELGLHVGGEPGVSLGANIETFDGVRALDANASGGRIDAGAGLNELVAYGAKVFALTIRQGDITARQRGRHHERAGLDPVRNDGRFHRIQMIDAMDLDDGRPRALDSRPHAVQHLGQGHHLRFARRVAQHGDPLRQHGRHEKVFRSGDRDGVKIDFSAF